MRGGGRGGALCDGSGVGAPCRGRLAVDGARWARRATQDSGRLAEAPSGRRARTWPGLGASGRPAGRSAHKHVGPGRAPPPASLPGWLPGQARAPCRQPWRVRGRRSAAAALAGLPEKESGREGAQAEEGWTRAGRGGRSPLASPSLPPSEAAPQARFGGSTWMLLCEAAPLPLPPDRGRAAVAQSPAIGGSNSPALYTVDSLLGDQKSTWRRSREGPRETVRWIFLKTRSADRSSAISGSLGRCGNFELPQLCD